MSQLKAYSIKMGPAKCAVDLGDGSERGEYVNQDYILNKMGRPHRSISLMYCYYPYDEQWPGRISEVMKDTKVSFQWDYPYDDYFTYKGGIGGNLEDEPFCYMRDVRRHGQDVTLTLTMDPFLDDERIIAIAKDLRTFGRLFLRANHEATGNWFSFNKRASYQQVADFYCRVTRIMHEYAPNVKMILCIDGARKLNAKHIEREKEFYQAVRETDIFSVDKYMALHWGWPYDVAETGGKSHSRNVVSDVYDMTKLSCELFTKICDGNRKPMVMSEFNADGDVVGPYDQCDMVEEFCWRLKKENAEWFSGLSFYQFRDRGRLGLEIQDVNNPDVGIEQPVMKSYKKIIHDDYFMPTMKKGGEISFPVKLRWGSSEDAEGICVPIRFEKNPHFCELYFEDDSNLIIEINGKWFYKSPKAKVIDLMPAFFEKPIEGEAELSVKMFAPPASGENDLSIEDGMFNTYATIEKLPKIRILYTPVEK